MNTILTTATFILCICIAFYFCNSLTTLSPHSTHFALALIRGSDVVNRNLWYVNAHFVCQLFIMGYDNSYTEANV